MRDRRLLYGAVVATLMALGCGEAEPPPGAVSTYRGGVITQSQAEQAMRREGLLQGGLTGDALVATYRRVSEGLVLRRHLLTEIEDIDEASAALGDEYKALRRNSLLDLYRQDQLGERNLQILQQDVDAYYAEHRETFSRVAQRNTWHIFRRHEDAKRPQATAEFLRSLRQRAQSGETFSRLAEEHSQSETRLFGGRLGWLSEGRLPPAVERAVFSLAEGEISDPIPLQGGAAIFKVTDVMEAKTFTQSDVKDAIIRRLVEMKTREAIEEVLEQRSAPEGSVVLETQEIMTLLRGGEDSDTVLEIGDFSLTVGELRKLREEDTKTFKGDWIPNSKERVEEIYTRELQDQLLYLDAVHSGFADVPAQKEAIEDRVRFLGRSRLLRSEIEERLKNAVDALPEERLSFYEDNSFLYQSGLRLRLETLLIPLAKGAEKKALAMEEARQELRDGKVDLEAVGRRLGGRVLTGDWIDFDDLSTFEPKVRYYILELGGTGFTQPFQLNDSLRMVWVKERDEPRQLPYAEVEEKVRADYLERNQQQLYRQMVDRVLAEVDFRFHEDLLRQALGLPEASATPVVNSP